MKHLKILTKRCTFILHLGPGGLCFFQLYMKLLELGLGASELGHRLIVVHLLDLVVLELLLVELFLTL